MKNISESDGLSREKRLKKASAEILLPILEERFPVLLARALCHSDFASHFYQHQSLIVLLEIELYDIHEAENAFLRMEGVEVQAEAVKKLLIRLEDWRKRLGYACLDGEPIQLLKDLTGQITANISPMFVVYVKQYGALLGKFPRQLWYTSQRSADEGRAGDFLQRFHLLLLASIRLLQSKCEAYREAISSSGGMDPSLAVVVAFLNNYKEIAVAFNHRWKSLPMFYINEILKATPRRKEFGRTWFMLERTDAGGEIILPKDTYLEITSGENVSGYKLNEEIQLTTMKVVKIEKVILERKLERYPEAGMKYATAIIKNTLPDNKYIPALVGVRVHSSMLSLNEGTREVNVCFHLTKESLAVLKEAVHHIACIQQLSVDEVQFKIFYDAFHLYVSTGEGGRQVENFQILFKKEFGLQLVFRLYDDFPAVRPLEGEALPSLRLQINPSAWLFPYSWARRIFIKSIRISVSVEGVQHIDLFNEIGKVDTCQPFYPFGFSAQKGSWFAFGNYEMACKRVSTIKLAFNWQQLPVCPGGLKEYYRHYKLSIDNTSFRVHIDQLRNRGWHPLGDGGSAYLFRTSNNPEPRKDEALIEHTEIEFPISEATMLPYTSAPDYRLGEVRSGFYRMKLTAPEMGFGESEYRRLFTEVMVLNSRRKKALPLPEPPMSLLMETPRLAYTADEEYYFKVGNVSDIKITYIRPLAEGIDSQPDYTQPIPLLEGPTDEGSLLIGISGAMGENLVRMYLDIELLQREIDHNYLPLLDWFYRDASKWVKVETINVLRDDTGGLMHSGAVILQFPFCVSSEMIDPDGLFWLCAGVHSNFCNCSKVREVFLNVVEVVPTEVRDIKETISGLSSFCQVSALEGERSEENNVELRTRMSERVSGRRRLLLPREYEQMVLQEFPEIAKVKCLPGIDAKSQSRRNMVTLVIAGIRKAERYPLCTDELLCRIEHLLRQYASPFVNIDAINPVYEEVTVFCGISLSSGETAGTSIQEVYENIRNCIAPWDEKEETPVFGYFFSLRDLLSRIKVSGRIESVHGIKLVQMIYNKNGLQYSFQEYVLQNGEEQIIAPSVPWAVLVPASRQYVKVSTAKEWREDIEFGDLEVENTFALK